MARKSRKNQAAETKPIRETLPVSEIVEKIPTAAYGRLSSEEEAGGQSMDNQIALIHDYINRQDELACVETYFDNGYSGTNFNRPAFHKLIDAVRQKKVSCIVVKDLSRFGRNMIESCYYIEKVFPFLGVRLIAVTDNFDSSRKSDVEGLAMPLKNLVNELYAKDISRKVWSSLQKKKKDGYAVGNSAPYGYIRNPETKRNEIDPETALYVQMIFMWAQMDVPKKEIADRLNLLGAPSPRGRLHQLGIIKEEILAGYAKAYEQCKESLESIRREKKETESRIQEFRDVVKDLKKYLNQRAFDAKLVLQLVERIEVGSDREIHLVYKFVSPFVVGKKEEEKEE